MGKVLWSIEFLLLFQVRSYCLVVQLKRVDALNIIVISNQTTFLRCSSLRFDRAPQTLLDSDVPLYDQTLTQLPVITAVHMH